MLALNETSLPSITNGAEKASAIREAIRSAASASTPSQSSANSSPPNLDTVSLGRRIERSRSATSHQDSVARVVPEAVVDGLEVVEVAEQQRQRAATPRRALASCIRSVNKVRLGSPVSGSCMA